MKAFITASKGNQLQGFFFIDYKCKVSSTLIFLFHVIYITISVPHCFINVFYSKESYYLKLLISTLHCLDHKIYNFFMSFPKNFCSHPLFKIACYKLLWILLLLIIDAGSYLRNRIEKKE